VDASVGKVSDDPAIRQAVDQLVHDAIVIWGQLSNDSKQHLSDALRCRYGISRELARDYLERAAQQRRGLRGD
jgi:hypothetical protein